MNRRTIEIGVKRFEISVDTNLRDENQKQTRFNDGALKTLTKGTANRSGLFPFHDSRGNI